MKKNITPTPTPQEVTSLSTLVSCHFSLLKGRLLLSAADPWRSVIAEQFRDDGKYIIHGRIHWKALKHGCLPGRISAVIWEKMGP